jgi:hypothetical protein
MAEEDEEGTPHDTIAVAFSEGEEEEDAVAADEMVAAFIAEVVGVVGAVAVDVAAAADNMNPLVTGS